MRRLTLEEMLNLRGGSLLDDPENCGAPGFKCTPGSGFCEDGVCKDAGSGSTTVTY